jgi:hypothetical protein
MAAAPAPASVVTRQAAAADWVCVECEQENEGTDEVCIACEEPRPAAPEPEVDDRYAGYKVGASFTARTKAQGLVTGAVLLSRCVCICAANRSDCGCGTSGGEGQAVCNPGRHWR